MDCDDDVPVVTSVILWWQEQWRMDTIGSNWLIVAAIAGLISELSKKKKNKMTNLKWNTTKNIILPVVPVVYWGSCRVGGEFEDTVDCFFYCGSCCCHTFSYHSYHHCYIVASAVVVDRSIIGISFVKITLMAGSCGSGIVKEENAWSLPSLCYPSLLTKHFWLGKKCFPWVTNFHTSANTSLLLLGGGLWEKDQHPLSPICVLEKSYNASHNSSVVVVVNALCQGHFEVTAAGV